ncbi:VWA domain-containing protein [Roseovarius aestuarii]|nr:VWA domain-containing protein [Roseovarius aestuarii]
MRHCTAKFAAFMVAGTCAFSAPAFAGEDVVIVYDASGSMWGQVDGTSKIEIARDVLADLVGKWDAGNNLGLVAYGHRRNGDCTDIETMIAPGKVDTSSFIATVNAIKPMGKTPISAAVQHAADLMAYRDVPATVILISDGVETCNADPCALATQLAQQGVKFTTHVVGFDLEDEAYASLSCIAENTGGVFVPASNATELNDALAQVQSVVVEQATAPVPEPEPTTPALPEVTITGPAQATTGAEFDVAWSQTISPRDVITIVPAGNDEGMSENHIRTRDVTEGTLTAPSEPGLYELRYLLNEGRKTLATAGIEVVAAEVTITGPAQATTGAEFDVAWSQTISPRDVITIVPAGNDEGMSENHIRTRDVTEGTLTAPSEPGLYELRYLLNEGRKTLATAGIEVVAAEIGIAGPGVVRAGSDVDVSWSSTVNPGDIVTIVPAGANGDAVDTHIRTRNQTEGRLEAPTDPGLYEIRYVLNEGRRMLTSTPLEVVPADAPLDDGAGLSVPTNAGVGETITVSWTVSSESADQRIALARVDQPDFSWVTVQSVGAGKSLQLAMPDTAGSYEIRYLDVSGRQILGRSIIEVK